jgi:hypothetical protein
VLGSRQGINISDKLLIIDEQMMGRGYINKAKWQSSRKAPITMPEVQCTWKRLSGNLAPPTPTSTPKRDQINSRAQRAPPDKTNSMLLWPNVYSEQNTDFGETQHPTKNVT